MGQIMKESLLSWQLNGRAQPALLCSPGAERELLTGHLLTGLFVRGVQEITALASNEESWQVKTAADAMPRSLGERLALLPACASDRRVTLAELTDLSQQLMRWDNSAGQHAVLLTDGRVRAFGCDIGRHNALDKAVGQGVALGLRLDQAVLCTSGRLSLEIFAKAAAVGIPILCTRKQVGDLACREAERLGIALAQLGRQVEIYGAADRVIREETP